MTIGNGLNVPMRCGWHSRYPLLPLFSSCARVPVIRDDGASDVLASMVPRWVYRRGSADERAHFYKQSLSRKTCGTAARGLRGP